MLLCCVADESPDAKVGAPSDSNWDRRSSSFHPFAVDSIRHTAAKELDNRSAITKVSQLIVLPV